MGKATSELDKEKLRRNWLRLVETTLSTIQRWADERGWAAARLEEREVRDSVLGIYPVRDLRVKTTTGILDVEVVARDVVGADGRIDFRAFPTMDRMLLIRTGGKWVVKTDSGIDWPRKWGKKTFIELAETLTKAP